MGIVRQVCVGYGETVAGDASCELTSLKRRDVGHPAGVDGPCLGSGLVALGVDGYTALAETRDGGGSVLERNKPVG